MRYLNRKVEQALATRVDPLGLAVFRIAWAIVMACEILQLYRFRHLVYDKIPYVVPSEIDWSWPLGLWMISVVLIGIGFQFRYATLANYLLALVCIGTIRSYEYHMFYVYMGMSFLLMFMPAANALSVDRLLLKLRCETPDKPLPTNDVSILNYRIPIFACIALVYFDSCFHKFGSQIWTSGLGAWLPANMPMVTRFDSSFLQNQRWLIVGLGYFTMLFEVAFIFLFWHRWFSWPLFICGLGLHIGIFMEFPIPWFALGVSAIYLLILPPTTWTAIAKRIRSNSSVQGIVSALFDGLKSVNNMSHGDRLAASEISASSAGFSEQSTAGQQRRALAITVFLLSISATQLLMIARSPLVRNTEEALGIRETSIVRSVENLSRSVVQLSRPTLGITPHGLFMDWHFEGYNHQLRVTHDLSGEVLPVSTESGVPSDYASGFLWAKWSFRINAPQIDQRELENGLRDFTAFWLHQTNYETVDANSFTVECRKVDSPDGWQRDFYHNQMDKPWQRVGTVKWEGKEFVSDLRTVEKI